MNLPILIHNKTKLIIFALLNFKQFIYEETIVDDRIDFIHVY